jgi:ubiquitin conjugation factor E4 B
MLLTLFSREPNPALDSLTPYLLLEPAEEKGISPDFLTEMEARIDEDESIKPMLRKAVIGLSQQLSTLTMNDNYKPYIHVSRLFPKFAHI